MNAKSRTARCCRRLRFGLVLLALLAVVPAGRGQYLEAPETTRTTPRLLYLKLDLEAEQTRQESMTTTARSKYERFYVSPALGIGWDYYVYHPDLMNFSILAEPGYVWQNSGPPGALSQENDVILNGNLRATLLQLKPYSTTFFANATHNTHQYDFFNTVTEDANAWGVSTGYREGPVPVTISFQSSSQDSTGLGYTSTSDQNIVNVHAINERQKRDISDLSYQYSEYHSTLNQPPQKISNSSSQNYLTATDTEHFNQNTLVSTVLYDQSTADSSSSDNLNVGLDYRVEHTPNLHSFYDYTFSRYTTDTGETLQHRATAGLQHQLYESLASAIDVHGLSAKSTYTTADIDLWSAGTSGSVNYSKRLGSWGHLTMGDTATLDFTDQESSGSALFIPNEPHTLLTGQWVRLNQPRVIAITLVTTDASKGNQPLTENVDYFVNRATDPWQIQINPFSLIIVSGDTVLVNYSVQPNPSGSYTTFSDQAQIRLDLWNGLAGVYTRYSFSDNHAYDPGFVLENYDELQTGLDVTHRGFRFNANYTDRHSTLFDFSSYNLTEAWSLRASARHSFSVDLHQQWSYYPGNGATNNPSYHVTYFDYLVRYDWHPISSLNWSAEGGYSTQHGDGLSQDLFAARTYLNWLVGKLDIHLGYEYQNQKFTADKRERHFVFLKATRRF